MPIAHKNEVPQDFLEQMRNNLKKESDNQTVTSQEAVSSAATVITGQQPSVIKTTDTPQKAQTNINAATEQKNVVSSEEKKEKYADVMNIRLSKGRRNEIKTFCSGCGISITQYIESSFEFLSKEVAAGRIVISKGGITRVE